MIRHNLGHSNWDILVSSKYVEPIVEPEDMTYDKLEYEEGRLQLSEEDFKASIP